MNKSKEIIYLKNNINYQINPWSWSISMTNDYLVPQHNVEKYLDLIRRRDALLLEKPELRIVQAKIDQTLKAVGNNTVERCQVISQIMLQSLYNLHRLHNEVVEDVWELQRLTSEFRGNELNQDTGNNKSIDP